MSRTYEDELKYLVKQNENCWIIKKGFVPNMKVCLNFMKKIP